MGSKPISDERARHMYESGRGDAAAQRLSRMWGRVFSLGLMPKRWVTLEVPERSPVTTDAPIEAFQQVAADFPVFEIVIQDG
jgi:hypothetical protein